MRGAKRPYALTKWIVSERNVVLSSRTEIQNLLKSMNFRPLQQVLPPNTQFARIPTRSMSRWEWTLGRSFNYLPGSREASENSDIPPSSIHILLSFSVRKIQDFIKNSSRSRIHSKIVDWYWAVDILNAWSWLRRTTAKSRCLGAEFSSKSYVRPNVSLVTVCIRHRCEFPTVGWNEDVAFIPGWMRHSTR